MKHFKTILNIELVQCLKKKKFNLPLVSVVSEWHHRHHQQKDCQKQGIRNTIFASNVVLVLLALCSLQNFPLQPYKQEQNGLNSVSTRGTLSSVSQSESYIYVHLKSSSSRSLSEYLGIFPFSPLPSKSLFSIPATIATIQNKASQILETVKQVQRKVSDYSSHMTI